MAFVIIIANCFYTWAKSTTFSLIRRKLGLLRKAWLVVKLSSITGYLVMHLPTLTRILNTCLQYIKELINLFNMLIRLILCKTLSTVCCSSFYCASSSNSCMLVLYFICSCIEDFSRNLDNTTSEDLCVFKNVPLIWDLCVGTANWHSSVFALLV